MLVSNVIMALFYMWFMFLMLHLHCRHTLTHMFTLYADVTKLMGNSSPYVSYVSRCACTSRYTIDMGRKVFTSRGIKLISLRRTENTMKSGFQRTYICYFCVIKSHSFYDFLKEKLGLSPLLSLYKLPTTILF